MFQTTQGPVSSVRMAEGGGEYKRGGKSKTWFGRFLLSQGYIKRSHWQVRARNLIERERNSNQSKAFSTEDSTDVVQKSNKKRQVPNCCLKYSSIYLSRCHNFPPTLESWFQISPPKKFSQYLHWLGVYTIKHNLVRSFFQFWFSISAPNFLG